MKIFSTCLTTISLSVFLFAACSTKKNNPTTLKDAFEGRFLIGTAMNSEQISGTDTASINLIKEQFNAIVPENVMKSEVIQPVEGEFNFTLADQFVEFGEKNNKFITGHALVWHSQTPKWLFVDEKGQSVSKEVMIKRMHDHITTVVSRYKGRVKGWDVVNEALNEDGTLRQSPFYKIIGPEYIQLAFEFAHAADPNAQLYYNDYGLYNKPKRDGAVKLIQSLKQKGCRVDAIGEQGHYGLDLKNIVNLDSSIVAFGKLNVKVMITELDVSVLPFPSDKITADVNFSIKSRPEFNPYPTQLPDSVQLKLTNYYSDLFKLFLKYQDNISRVTFWGVNDAQTWKNNWPIAGRTDYPLLFDRDNKPKPVVEAIIKMSTTK
jgi:endo-1,4-beta-xylanase